MAMEFCNTVAAARLVEQLFAIALVEVFLPGRYHANDGISRRCGKRRDGEHNRTSHEPRIRTSA
jgi:hypothetical protein